jgi:dienelactone hydrolase
MRTPTRLLALGALAFLPIRAPAGEPRTLALPAGPHPVGFRVVGHRDATRRTADGGPRPVQVSVWFPAARTSTGPVLRYRDYVVASSRERTLAATSAEDDQAALGRYRAFLAGNGVSAAGIEEWLEAPMRAREGAPAASGRFEVVLVAQGMGGAVHDQSALGEALASHGYVVVTTPSPVRLGAKMESEADVPVMAREQERDLETALSVVAPLPMADARRVGVVGYSFGARPALLLAGRCPAVRALVSLDGGIGSAAAKGWLSPRALDRAALRTPILHVYEEADEDARPDFALLASLVRAPRTIARVHGLRHLDFITFGLASATLGALGGPDDRRAGSLEAVFALTRGFIQAHVSGSARSWEDAVAEAAAGAHVRVMPFGRARPGSVSSPRRVPES